MRKYVLAGTMAALLMAGQAAASEGFDASAVGDRLGSPEASSPDHLTGTSSWVWIAGLALTAFVCALAFSNSATDIPASP